LRARDSRSSSSRWESRAAEAWWLFDATGALVAQGGGCIGDGPGCRAAVPGLQLPYQCFVNGGWPQKVSLCPDAGVDAGAPEAASDVLDEAD